MISVKHRLSASQRKLAIIDGDNSEIVQSLYGAHCPRNNGHAAANGLDVASASDYSLSMKIENPTIARFKTAIRRYDLSLPMKCAIADGLIASTVSVFDYGCGQDRRMHGADTPL
jgi:hypothetical protein